MILFGSDKCISLRTSGFVNPLVRRTSRFFDEIRALLVEAAISRDAAESEKVKVELFVCL